MRNLFARNASQSTNRNTSVNPESNNVQKGLGRISTAIAVVIIAIPLAAVVGLFTGFLTGDQFVKLALGCFTVIPSIITGLFQ